MTSDKWQAKRLVCEVANIFASYQSLATTQASPQRAYQLLFPRSRAHLRAPVGDVEEMLCIVFQQQLLREHEVGDRNECLDVAAVSRPGLEAQYVEG